VSGAGFQVSGAQGDIATIGETQAVTGSKEEYVTIGSRARETDSILPDTWHLKPGTRHLPLPFRELVNEFNDLAHKSINELPALL
jgi:hypothetical protein